MGKQLAGWVVKWDHGEGRHVFGWGVRWEILAREGKVEVAPEEVVVVCLQETQATELGL